MDDVEIYAALWAHVHAWKRGGISHPARDLEAILADVGAEPGDSLHTVLLDLKRLGISTRTHEQLARGLQKFKSRITLPEHVARIYAQQYTRAGRRWDELLAVSKTCPQRKSDEPLTLDIRHWHEVLDSLVEVEPDPLAAAHGAKVAAMLGHDMSSPEEDENV